MAIKPSFQLKLDRAGQHLEELRTEIDRWIKSRPYRLTDELDPNNGDNVIYGQLLRFAPPLIVHLIGDCLQNLRSCLDHLAYALALANKGTLTDAEATDTAFPIFCSEAGFNSRGKGRIKHLSVRAQAIIEGLQPYHADEPTHHLLWLLKTLNDIDKHRRLLVTMMTPIGAGVHQPLGANLDFFDWSDFDGFSEKKTELARYRCIQTKSSTRVKVDFRPTPIVIFGDIAGNGRMVEVLLDNIGRWIGSLAISQLKASL